MSPLFSETHTVTVLNFGCGHIGRVGRLLWGVNGRIQEPNISISELVELLLGKMRVIMYHLDTRSNFPIWNSSLWAGHYTVSEFEMTPEEPVDLIMAISPCPTYVEQLDGIDEASYITSLKKLVTRSTKWTLLYVQLDSSFSRPCSVAPDFWPEAPKGTSTTRGELFFELLLRDMPQLVMQTYSGQLVDSVPAWSRVEQFAPWKGYLFEVV